jgi:hypothetical protein
VAAKLGYTILKTWKKIECVLEQDAEEDVCFSGRRSNMGLRKFHIGGYINCSFN